MTLPCTGTPAAPIGAPLPAKPLFDRDGNPRRTGAGKIKYAKMISFDSRAVADAFGDAVIEALLKFNPTVFDESAA